MNVNIFNVTIHSWQIPDGMTVDQYLLERCNGFEWGEQETTCAKLPSFSRLIVSSNGIDAYYCYGSDHYFFTEA